MGAGVLLYARDDGEEWRGRRKKAAIGGGVSFGYGPLGQVFLLALSVPGQQTNKSHFLLLLLFSSNKLMCTNSFPLLFYRSTLKTTLKTCTLNQDELGNHPTHKGLVVSAQLAAASIVYEGSEI